MDQKPEIMDEKHMRFATYHAKARETKWIELSNAIVQDTYKTERLNRHECKTCFYSTKFLGRIGGAAITFRPCMSCGKSEYYPSTITDVLCLECAKKHKLCKHCGGDIKMNLKRKNWPKN